MRPIQREGTNLEPVMAFPQTLHHRHRSGRQRQPAAQVPHPNTPEPYDSAAQLNLRAAKHIHSHPLPSSTALHPLSTSLAAIHTLNPNQHLLFLVISLQNASIVSSPTLHALANSLFSTGLSDGWSSYLHHEVRRVDGLKIHRSLHSPQIHPRLRIQPQRVRSSRIEDRVSLAGEILADPQPDQR